MFFSGRRVSYFIGQPSYSLKNICLGGDTVEKPVIFEAKSESSTASIQRLSPLGMPFLTFIGQQYQFIAPSIESNVFAVPSPTHKGSINGRRLVPPVVRATPSDWGL